MLELESIELFQVLELVPRHLHLGHIVLVRRLAQIVNLGLGFQDAPRPLLALRGNPEERFEFVVHAGRSMARRRQPAKSFPPIAAMLVATV
jgi:hypothetical protein